MFLKRKEEKPSNWSEMCSEFIKVVLRRRTSKHHHRLLNDPNLCLDQLSEFQKSYVSFPEFSDSTISTESSDSNQSWASASTTS
ncbi:hypothetical protein INT47_005224 [Mucor saturninus]|uniref:Uncharacterized protein n=1 Tax=Mucor saturninus TaxID=64648 RepID=A0A8H7R703_9FUNG|nr:hypothetical protein INT47_005224 [Mucor saturninus]